MLLEVGHELDRDDVADSQTLQLIRHLVILVGHELESVPFGRPVPGFDLDPPVIRVEDLTGHGSHRLENYFLDVDQLACVVPGLIHEPHAAHGEDTLQVEEHPLAGVGGDDVLDRVLLAIRPDHEPVVAPIGHASRDGDPGLARGIARGRRDGFRSRGSGRSVRLAGGLAEGPRRVDRLGRYLREHGGCDAVERTGAVTQNDGDWSHASCLMAVRRRVEVDVGIDVHRQEVGLVLAEIAEPVPGLVEDDGGADVGRDPADAVRKNSALMRIVGRA